MWNCSPEAIAERQRQREILERSLSDPTISLSDRSRSMTSASFEDRLKALARLDRYDAYCESGGQMPRRIAHPPLLKGY